MSTITIPTLIDSVIDRMTAFDRHYQLGLWPERARPDRRHDITLMAIHGDLRGLSTELLDAADVVLAELAVSFDGANLPQLSADSYWPLIDRSRVARGRLLVHRGDNEAAYRDELRLHWRPASPLRREEGDACGSFYLGESHCRRLMVTRSGARYGFGDFADEGAARAHVFLLPQFADPAALPFREGQRLSALILATPEGLQGRAIRAY